MHKKARVAAGFSFERYGSAITKPRALIDT